MYFYRVKSIVLHIKHWINGPFAHNLQITLINVTIYTRKMFGFTRKTIH